MTCLKSKDYKGQDSRGVLTLIPIATPSYETETRGSPDGHAEKFRFKDKLTTCSSVQFSRSVVSANPWTACPPPTPGVYSNSGPLTWWCHPTISSSVIPFSSYLQSFPASESFPMSQLFPSSGQTVGVSVSASDLPMNIQDWFPLG